MQAHVWRAASGKVLFLEAGSDVMDALESVLKAPLHHAVRLAASNGNLQQGVAKPLLRLMTSDPLQQRFSASDSKKASLSEPAGVQGPPKYCPWCLMRSGTRSELQPEGEYCKVCNSNLAYSPKVCEGTCPKCQRTDMPIIVNSCCSHSQCCGINWLRYDLSVQQKQEPGVLCCTRCAADGKGKQALLHNRTCGHCNVGSCPVCPCCSHCEACSLCSLGYELAGLPAKPATPNTNKVMATKFLVTNTLECMAATPENTIDFLKSCPEVQLLQGLTKQVVDVTVEHLWLMVLRGCGGSTNVLIEAFPLSSTEDTSGDGSASKRLKR